MAEITLTLLLEPVETADAFDAALAKRRWTRVEALPSTWTCYFDAAFLEQVERIMTSDVEGAAAEAGVKRWRGVGAVAAIPTSVVGPADAAPVRRPAREVWADGATPVGPLGEVVVTFDAATEPLGAALKARHWTRLADLPSTWMHPFDLGIFAPMDELVRDELAIVTGDAGLAEWRAAWALATWGHVSISSREQAPPGPYADWRW